MYNLQVMCWLLCVQASMTYCYVKHRWFTHDIGHIYTVCEAGGGGGGGRVGSESKEGGTLH